MKAVLLAGGKGARLHPYTAVIPKPLMPIGEHCVVDILLRQLAHAGVREVLLCVGHQAALIEGTIGSGETYGLRITYRREAGPLGTIGPIRAHHADLPERFLVMNADILCDLDFAAFDRAGAESPAPLTIAVCKRTVQTDFGVIDRDPEGRVLGFREKPSFSYWANMGVYSMRREILRFIPAERPFGFDDLMAALLAEGAPVATFPFEGSWLDIGKSEDLALAQRGFESNRERYLPT